MTSRIFTQDLKAILEAGLDVPVTVYDENAEQVVPSIIIGVDNEESHETLSGNYKLESFIVILTNGYDDKGNDNAEILYHQIFDTIQNEEVECLDGIFFMGADRTDGEESTRIVLRFEVYTHTV